MTRVAMGGAALMVAHQVAGKAARDALFLSQYPPSALPKVVMVAALVALIAGWLFSQLLERFGPKRVVPLAFCGSAILHIAEWLLLDTSRNVTVVAVYLHVVALGAVLLSGFWSLAGEMFDPRAARLRFGTIAASGTAGGISGGLIAERIGALSSTDAILIALAVFHLCSGLVLFRFASFSDSAVKEFNWKSSARDAFRNAPFLWGLAALVFLGTSSAALVDYLFKSSASAAIGKGPALLRFFAIFYTGGQVLTLLMQGIASRFALERLGLGRTVMSLPLVVGGGSIASLMFPVFPVVAAVRGLELAFRGSLFRAGYEIFYTPIPPGDKRAVKTLIDVFCDRMGDAAGALLVQVLLSLGPSLARAQILTAAVLLSGVSVWLARRMDRAYLGVLERGLMNRAIELDIADVHDSTTMSAVLHSAPVRLARGSGAPIESEPEVLAVSTDPAVARLNELRSRDAQRVRKALRAAPPIDELAAQQAIRLLAWDAVSADARKALEEQCERFTGQLSDAMLDESTDFAIRRRIPRILARAGTQRAADSLAAALNDPRFEVRFHAGRALEYLRRRKPELDFNGERVLAVIDKELSVSRGIWANHRILDTRDESEQFLFLDDLLKERANQSLEHIFSLLALVLDWEPLKIAFRGLHAEDRVFRGLALEYLNGVLPEGVRDKLWALLETPAAPQSRPVEAVLHDLMRSHQSIVLKVPGLKSPYGDAAPPTA